MLDCCHLRVAYRDRIALDDVCLHLGRGQLVGLIGPNGAGKSTLLKAILGLVPIAAGSITWDGQPVARVRRRLAYVPQRSSVDWSYPITAETVVRLGLEQGRLGWGRGRSERVEAALERLEITDLRDRPIGELSGGQQQRVFLARALVQRAELLLLDEPLTGVDRRTELILQGLFDQLRASGHTLVVCSHEWGEALRRYDRLVLINRTVVAAGDPVEVLEPQRLLRAYAPRQELGSRGLQDLTL